MLIHLCRCRADGKCWSFHDFLNPGRFEKTGHPLLDGKVFRIQIWNDVQFLLFDADKDENTALTKDIETSMGVGHLKHTDSLVGRGIMIPFSLWQILLVAGLVGAVALAELKEMTGAFRLTLTEAAMLFIGAAVAVLVHWRQQSDLDLQLSSTNQHFTSVKGYVA